MILAPVSLSRALADCVEAIEGGEQLERCLERHPQYREHLRPLLEVAQTLRGNRPEAQPSPYFIIDLKERLTRTPGERPKGDEAGRKKG